MQLSVKIMNQGDEIRRLYVYFLGREGSDPKKSVAIIEIILVYFSIITLINTEGKQIDKLIQKIL